MNWKTLAGQGHAHRGDTLATALSAVFVSGFKALLAGWPAYLLKNIKPKLLIKGIMYVVILSLTNLD